MTPLNPRHQILKIGVAATDVSKTFLLFLYDNTIAHLGLTNAGECRAFEGKYADWGSPPYLVTASSAK